MRSLTHPSVFSTGSDIVTGPPPDPLPSICWGWGVEGVSDSIPEQVRKEPSQTDLDTFSHLIAVPIRLRSETIQPCPSLHLGRLVARTPERRRRRIGLCVTATCTL